jgi:protein-tyrosine phosphatase
VIDLHSHILPGIDDGAESLRDSLEIASACVADGIEVLAATPHVRDDYPTRPETMERLVAQVREALAAARVPLELRPGGEIAVDWLERLSSEQLQRFGLAGNPRYVLVEFPYYGWPLTLPERAFRLQLQRVTIVLGHPERSAEVHGNPERLRPLVEAGVLVQVTASSLDGRLGRGPEETARELIERGLAHMIASDAHMPAIREAGMAAAVSAIGDEALARWLAYDVPGAILTGEPLPRRPARTKRKRGVFRR